MDKTLTKEETFVNKDAKPVIDVPQTTKPPAEIEDIH